MMAEAKAEADAALVATSALDVDADLPVGQGAAAALARRTEAIFTKQSWGHWWDVMCAEHPILNIVFVHDDTPRFVRIWAFAFEVLCGLWGMALEVMLSYPEPDPECASYTAQWEACDYCPEAIVDGVCRPEKIGQLGTVVQDQGDGTFAEVETTICPKAWKAARTAGEERARAEAKRAFDDFDPFGEEKGKAERAKVVARAAEARALSSGARALGRCWGAKCGRDVPSPTTIHPPTFLSITCRKIF